MGALVGGGLSQLLQGLGYSPVLSYRVVVLGYGLIGLIMTVLFLRLSPSIEISGNPSERSLEEEAGKRRFLGLHRSRKVVLRLAALFSLDAFAGGFVVQSLLVLWFNLKFGVEPAVLGAIFFGANILAGAYREGEPGEGGAGVTIATFK